MGIQPLHGGRELARMAARAALGKDFLSAQQDRGVRRDIFVAARRVFELVWTSRLQEEQGHVWCLRFGRFPIRRVLARVLDFDWCNWHSADQGLKMQQPFFAEQ